MTGATISIVIPSYGRPARLARCLAALARQEGGPYETIVIDDGSPEPLKSICDKAGPWVRSIRQDNSGPAAARNKGVSLATGEFICFTDDDCLPEPGWAKALLAAQGGDRHVLVGGRVENAFPDNLFSETSQSITNWLYAWHKSNGSKAQFFASNNIGCAKRTFLEMGGFDESFPLAAGEDRDFGMRWSQRAGPLVFAPDARIWHAHDLDMKGFWRQQSNYGRGARHLHGLADAEAGPTERFAKPAFYAGLVLHPMWRPDLRPSRRFALTALACLSQVAIAKGYLSAG